MKKHHRILQRLVQRRWEFYNRNWEENKSIDNSEYLKALRIVFGSPENTLTPCPCIVCGKELPEREVKDLDSFFCSACCPVCEAENMGL